MNKPQEQVVALLRESSQAELALIGAELDAERELHIAEDRFRRSLEKLERAERRVERRRRAFEQARARLDQCQLERAAGPLVRPVAVARPALPRPVRDDSRARARAAKKAEPAPEGTGSNGTGSESDS